MRRGVTLAVGVALVALLVAAGAAQATPNRTQYGNPVQSSPAVSKPTVSGAKPSHKTEAAPTSTPPAAAPTTVKTQNQGLPFTGLSLLAYVLLGGAFVVTGLALRRTAARRGHE